MGANGVAEIDFGSFPGTSDASLTVTGLTGIISSSLVEAWLMPDTTADHSADEHLLEPIKVFADRSSIVAGTSLVIRAINDNRLAEPLESPGVSKFRSAATTVYGAAEGSVGGRLPMVYGLWKVGWVWQ